MLDKNIRNLIFKLEQMSYLNSSFVSKELHLSSILLAYQTVYQVIDDTNDGYMNEVGL